MWEWVDGKDREVEKWSTGRRQINKEQVQSTYKLPQVLFSADVDGERSLDRQPQIELFVVANFHYGQLQKNISRTFLMDFFGTKHFRVIHCLRKDFVQAGLQSTSRRLVCSTPPPPLHPMKQHLTITSCRNFILVLFSLLFLLLNTPLPTTRSFIASKNYFPLSIFIILAISPKMVIQ